MNELINFYFIVNMYVCIIVYGYGLGLLLGLASVRLPSCV